MILELTINLIGFNIRILKFRFDFLLHLVKVLKELFWLHQRIRGHEKEFGTQRSSYLSARQPQPKIEVVSS